MPSGPCVWQVKSGSTKPVVGREFDSKKHEALFALIANGYDYVLFWTNDPIDHDADDVRHDFTAATKDIRTGAAAHFFFADAIERLCYAHLGVLAQESPYPLAGLVNLARWGAPQKFSDVEFQEDELRSHAVPLIQSHVATFDSEPYELHVFGDTGVGKTRLVYEALARPGIVERVLVAPDASQFDRGLLTHVANSDERRLILVVDDCEATDRSGLARYAGMAEGRIRLLTIGPRWSREQPSADMRRIEVLPLEAQASRQIAQSIGLGDRDADLVAEYTEGYPGLALALARAIRFGDETETLVDRVRGHEEVGSVLASLVPPEDVPRLAILALFEKLGLEGDLAQELALVCRLFEIDEADIRAVVNRELGRFVSSAGRFRRVTPRLFAVWLATQLLSSDKDTLRTALAGLPESLRDRIVTQVRDFAGDPVVGEVLGETLAQHPFLEGALGDVDEGASRLLHVASIAAPTAAMAAVERLLAGATQEQLLAFKTGRREMVWALEVLLWFEELFDRAATAMLRLAMAENETWANNATGVIQGVFRVFLGGTAAPYSQRLRWAREAINEFGAIGKPTIVEALGHAFESQETRGSTHFGGRTAPQEWRPKRMEEELDARGGSWDLLINIALSSPELSDQVAKVLANGLSTAVARGLSERVLRDLRTVPWSPAGRGLLGDALAKTLKYGKPAEELSSHLRTLEVDLRGRELDDRLDYAFSLSPWQLSTQDEEVASGRPLILRELAAELAGAERAYVLSSALRSGTADQQTVSILFDELSRITDDDELLGQVESLDPLPEAALLGTLRGLAEHRGDAWTDAVLERWSESSHLAHLVVPAVHLLQATDERARLAIVVTDRGYSAPGVLGRFLYGAWTRPLSESAVTEIVKRLAAEGGPYEVEHGLGILEQWLDERDTGILSTDFRFIALELIKMSNQLGDSRSAMVPLYRTRVLRALELNFDERMAIAVETLRSLTSFPDSDDLEVIDGLIAEDAPRTIESMVDLLTGDAQTTYQPWLMWLEEASILSRLEHRASPEQVTEVVLSRVDPNRWTELLAHIDFSSDEPDPLLKAILDRSDSHVLLDPPVFRFLYPKSGWTGPESAHLRMRRRVAERWINAETTEGGFRAWLEAVLQEIDRRVATVEIEEAERGY